MSAELKDVMPPAAAQSQLVEALTLPLEMRTNREIRYSILHTLQPVFAAEEKTIVNVVGDREVFMVIDRNVDRLYGESLRGQLNRQLKVVGTLVLEGDESQKTWLNAELICKAALDCQLSRTGIIVGIGGGVILDLSGFAASIYRRGVGYLRIPTTLIGQVDVSVGIKQAVNAGHFKNVFGSFYPPIASINDPSFLKTLPLSHIAAGCAEIIKMAVIADPALFSLLEKHGRTLLESRFQEPPASIVMWRAELSMLRELEGNLFETDLKRRVDFGHTFSNALEIDSSYELSHGYAVGFDMLISTSIAARRGLCSTTLLDRMLAMYKQVELPLSQRVCSADRLHSSLDSVRKHRGGALNLVVPTELGHISYIQDFSKDELADSLASLAKAQAEHDQPRL